MSRLGSPGVVLRIVALMLLLACSPIVPAGRAAAGRDADAPEPREQQVRFASDSDSLAGTLYWPVERVGCPAVVVLAGSDRSRRGAVRSAIAESLANRGIAALVYDSPGTGASSGNAMMQSSADRVREALSALGFLEGLPAIRPGAVGLFGGSEGANIALLACAEDPGPAFAIPVSGSLGVSVLDILRYSAEKRGYRRGLSTDEIARAVAFKEIVFVLLSGADIVEWSLIAAKAERWEDADWPRLVDLVRRFGESSDPRQRKAFLDSFRAIVTHFAEQRWFAAVDVGNAVERMLSLDDATFFRLLESERYSGDWERSLCIGEAGRRCPVLAIWGEEDSFLPPRQSAARLGKYLEDSDWPDYELVVFPGGSHTLTAPGSATNFVPGYFDTMATWIKTRFGPEGRGEPQHAHDRSP